MRKAPLREVPNRFVPRQKLPPELLEDDEEHWLQVNARANERPLCRPEETGSRWWE